jgi:hypothetical protein
VTPVDRMNFMQDIFTSNMDDTMEYIHILELATGLNPEDYKEYCEEYKREHNTGNPLFKELMSYDAFLEKHL